MSDELQEGTYVEFSCPWLKGKTRHLGIVRGLEEANIERGIRYVNVTIECGDLTFIIRNDSVRTLSALEQLAMIGDEE